MGDLIVLGSLLAIIALIIRKMKKDKEAGKSCCSGGCSSCKNCPSGKKVVNKEIE